MSRKPDRYGSPYDPINGKMLRQEEKRPEETSFRLFGCRDPDCFQCNPESAEYRERTGQRGRPIETPQRPAYATASAVDYAYDEVIRLAGSALNDPPQSYKSAREKVEKFIIEAPEVGFDDIVGNEDALACLRDAIEAPIKHKEVYEAYGLKMPKGALLSGPPGCGKTMFAKAAATEMKKLYGKTSEIIAVSGPDIQSPFVGLTEEKIRDMFDYAREYQAFHGHPLVIFIDEAEVILPDRTGRVRRVAPWEESQVAEFLVQMDGMQGTGAFVLLASNRPEVIDQAVLRDGRCDFKITVKRPTQEAVEVIIRKNFGSVPLGATIDELVFAAIESLYDPHRVITDAKFVKLNFEEKKLDFKDRHFLLSHILSGAMVASIPKRAARFAFNRDKTDGVVRGVLVEDMLKAVNALFEENKNLEHAYAMNEFVEQVQAELNHQDRQENKGLN